MVDVIDEHGDTPIRTPRFGKCPFVTEHDWVARQSKPVFDVDEQGDEAKGIEWAGWAKQWCRWRHLDPLMFGTTEVRIAKRTDHNFNYC
ncbi:MAG: hypothetical protein ACREA0_25355 [bacterium]